MEKKKQQKAQQEAAQMVAKIDAAVAWLARRQRQIQLGASPIDDEMEDTMDDHRETALERYKAKCPECATTSNVWTTDKAVQLVGAATPPVCKICQTAAASVYLRECGHTCICWNCLPITDISYQEKLAFERTYIQPDVVLQMRGSDTGLPWDTRRGALRFSSSANRHKLLWEVVVAKFDAAALRTNPGLAPDAEAIEYPIHDGTMMLFTGPVLEQVRGSLHRLLGNRRGAVRASIYAKWGAYWVGRRSDVGCRLEVRLIQSQHDGGLEIHNRMEADRYTRVKPNDDTDWTANAQFVKGYRDVTAEIAVERRIFKTLRTMWLEGSKQRVVKRL
jgi:hypothetical protein